MADATFRLLGGNWEAFTSREADICVEGPRGTGKSVGIGLKLHTDAQTYPGSRQLVVRKTLQSLRESFQVTFEEKILGIDNPLLGGVSREHRRSYHYPNGSVIVLGGLDKPGRFYSSEWDRVFVNEIIELTNERQYTEFDACLRNDRMPFQQLMCDVNPGDPNHFINKRMERGETLRILSRHKDNPGITERYLERLRRLKGSLYLRWYEGKWCINEGLVLPNFDREVHVKTRDFLVQKDPDNPESEGRKRPVWYFGSFDWGHTNPGCFQVWAVWGTGLERTLCCVHEVYAVERNMDWWCSQVEEAHDRWKLRQLVCDPSRPEHIETMNDRLGGPGGRTVFRIAIGADNRKTEKGTGLDMFRWALGNEGDEPARMYWLEDCLAFRDEKLEEKGEPCGSLEEITGYVWEEWKEGKHHNENTKDGIADHAMDAARYAACHAWKIDIVGKEVVHYDANQYGFLFDDEAVLRGDRKALAASQKRKKYMGMSGLIGPPDPPKRRSGRG